MCYPETIPWMEDRTMNEPKFIIDEVTDPNEIATNLSSRFAQ
jgi:hypothetical protein